jgi:hypothetical protein
MTSLLARPMVAIVGTRNASALGARMARRLARDLGEAGFVVVSGLARGIDALAHEARWRPARSRCTQAGSTCSTRPKTRGWRDQIGKTGLRLSEMPFGLQPQGRHFPRRNRIVSGLARGRDRGGGGGAVGLAHHRALRARSGARGHGGAGPPARQPRLGGQHPAAGRRDAGAGGR